MNLRDHLDWMNTLERIAGEKNLELRINDKDIDKLEFKVTIDSCGIRDEYINIVTVGG